MSSFVSVEVSNFQDVVIQSNGAPTGAGSITVVGTHGGFCASSSAKFESAGEITAWASSTLIAGKVTGAGASFAPRVAVTSDLFWSCVTSRWSYSLMQLSTLDTNAGGTGSSSVTVIGTNLGQSEGGEGESAGTIRPEQDAARPLEPSSSRKSPVGHSGL
eukprot:CAMPEP_0175904726 /NCGR_PEP_ID=MMETSP0108-20121206/4630_1 /TAXON_ID=195067 ORGANISM="Goniomonas pacifica, Strain CCMP1869" /NCGR_SAMPLE_ID=MMETSP0108 /ASSEMBLY_ACC=CAM_ASM_000204 /LENGTH=159 /DNA_ID=CAMNT_0017226557 /DNA_START=109 /DNA_END=589 /DNA_ORIENTATION=+